ncbi:MAG: anthranilate synthase component I family protein [Actinobacteria bacterium]|nr:anthranilate synthase component I family protein [Actinomycetota bacterium]
MVGSSVAFELREPANAFRLIEAWLREQGFFAPGGEKLTADLYLGYGLSQTISRSGAAPAAEPCPSLPLVACAVRSNRYVVEHGNSGDILGDIRVGAWAGDWSAADYAAAVERARAAIARGDVYQVNLVQHLSAACSGPPAALAAKLASLSPLHPDPFVGEAWAVVSASPELFLARRGRRVWTMPIKGTRPLGAAAELRASAKDAAEHVMIVELERNDLSRVCEPGTVRWPELMSTRELAGVEHLVSTVEGTLREGVDLAEILEATFPGGSVTGAPKIAAVDLIAELEPVGRGASMGALGRVYGNGDFDLALTIRTFAIAEGRIHLWVGGGVVWDSDPAAEVEESWTKARPLLEALGSTEAALAGMRA